MGTDDHGDARLGDNFSSCGYSGLFHGLELTDRLPSLKALLAIRGPRRRLTEGEDALVRQNWGAFEKIVARSGYEIVAGELDILTDERLLRPGEDVHFNNFIFTYTNPVEPLEAAYVNGMYDMKKFLPSEWIVWHSGLYDGSHAMVTFDLRSLCTDEQRALRSDPAPISAIPSVTFDELDRQQSRQIQRAHQQSTTKPTRQLAEFYTRLINNCATAPDLVALLRDCFGVIVPFARPGSSPVDPKLSRIGGIVMLVVKPSSHAKRGESPDELGRRISFLLMNAMLVESSLTLDLEAEHRRILGSMVHGTVTAIRSIRTTDLSSSLSYSTPPGSVEDLRVRLVDRETGTPKPDLENTVVRGLHNAILSEDSAAALLSFSEINLNVSRIRSKFLNRDERSLRQIFEEAFLMANHPSAMSHELSVSQSEALQDLGCWIIPVGYLDAKLIRGVIGELLRNAAEHGIVEPDGTVSLGVAGRQVSSECIALHIYNRTEAKTATNGFLEGTRFALNSLGQDIHLDFERSDDQFNVFLQLGPLVVETPGGERTVAPRKIEDKTHEDRPDREESR